MFERIRAAVTLQHRIPEHQRRADYYRQRAIQVSIQNGFFLKDEDGVDLVEDATTSIIPVGDKVLEFAVDSDGICFARIKDGEVFLANANIQPWMGSQKYADSRRERKLLLHKKQILAWHGKISGGNLTIVPLSLNIKNQSLFTVPNINVVVVLYDKNRNAISASRTFLDELSKEEQQTIVFTWPLAFKGEVVTTEVLPAYNIFDVKLR